MRIKVGGALASPRAVLAILLTSLLFATAHAQQPERTPAPIVRKPAADNRTEKATDSRAPDALVELNSAL
jgi:hypothetical protein